MGNAAKIKASKANSPGTERLKCGTRNPERLSPPSPPMLPDGAVPSLARTFLAGGDIGHIHLLSIKEAYPRRRVHNFLAQSPQQLPAKTASPRPARRYPHIGNHPGKAHTPPCKTPPPNRTPPSPPPPVPAPTKANPSHPATPPNTGSTPLATTSSRSKKTNSPRITPP